MCIQYCDNNGRTKRKNIIHESNLLNLNFHELESHHLIFSQNVRTQV